MLLKKIFVGISASLTVFGLSLIGLQAYADNVERNESIDITSSNTSDVKGHQFKYARITSYRDANSAQIDTVAEMKTSAANAVAKALNVNVPSNVDPLTWAQGRESPNAAIGAKLLKSNSEPSKAFAQALSSQVVENGDSIDCDQNPCAMSGLLAGVYEIVDVTPGQNSGSQRSVVASTHNSAVGARGVAAIDGSTVGNPVKVVRGSDDKSLVSYGDEQHFQALTTVPTMNAGTTNSLQFRVTLSSGLMFDGEPTNLTLKYGDANNQVVADQRDYSLDSQATVASGSSQAASSFTVSLSNHLLEAMQSSAGQPLELDYTLRVTDQSPTSAVSTYASVIRNGKGSSNSVPAVLHTNTFDFSSIWSDGSAASGAQFLIKDAQGNKVANLVNCNGAQCLVSGVKDGAYEVQETKPAGSAQALVATFGITLTYNGGTNKTDVTLNNAHSIDPFHLVRQDNNGKITITNMKALTQLPLTGGSVGMILSIIGLLLFAGFAVSVMVRKARANR